MTKAIREKKRFLLAYSPSWWGRFGGRSQFMAAGTHVKGCSRYDGLGNREKQEPGLGVPFKGPLLVIYFLQLQPTS